MFDFIVQTALISYADGVNKDFLINFSPLRTDLVLRNVGFYYVFKYIIVLYSYVVVVNDFIALSGYKVKIWRQVSESRRKNRTLKRNE